MYNIIIIKNNNNNNFDKHQAYENNINNIIHTKRRKT